MVYILCYHVFKNLPQDEDCEVDQDLIVEAGLTFICEYISNDAVKYMEYDCVEHAINTYVASSQWLAEHYVTYRSEILKYFLLMLFFSSPLGNIKYINPAGVETLVAC